MNKQSNSNPGTVGKKSPFKLISTSLQLQNLAGLASVNVTKLGEIKFGTVLAKGGYSSYESVHKKRGQRFAGFTSVFNAHPEFAQAKYVDFFGFCMFTDNQIDIQNFDNRFGSMVRKAGNGLSIYLSKLGKSVDVNASLNYNYFVSQAGQEMPIFFVRNVETGKPIELVPELFTGSSKVSPAQRSALSKSLAEYGKVQQFTNSYQLVIDNEKSVKTPSVEDLKSRKQISIKSLVHQELPK